jgi:hypothetical protein
MQASGYIALDLPPDLVTYQSNKVLRQSAFSYVLGSELLWTIIGVADVPENRIVHSMSVIYDVQLDLYYLIISLDVSELWPCNL